MVGDLEMRNRPPNHALHLPAIALRLQAHALVGRIAVRGSLAASHAVRTEYTKAGPCGVYLLS